MSLKQERSSISLDLESLTSLIYSYVYPEVPMGKIRLIREKLLTIPELSLDLSRYHDSPGESLIRSLKFGQSWQKLILSESFTESESVVASENFLEITPYFLHAFLFRQSVCLQASKEQLTEWLPKINSSEIFGCYAQTELAHGSNVRGLEIEANYDHENQEFILNSPSDTACKWWIGGLGNCANHALLIAQLKIGGAKYGPHVFLVPIRNNITHEPFPGVDVGEIGPRQGAVAANNGFLRFENYRIAKKYMLNRFSRITDTGKYEILDPNSIKILYISLVKARINVINDVWYTLSCALTIAIRYSFSRQQFPDPDLSNTEMKIIDYQIQQSKLFKPLALLYAFIFARKHVELIYEKAKSEAEAGDSPTLSLAHFIVCLYKVYVTTSNIISLESCRRSCGGHGYLMASGLPTIYANYLPAATYDGDNSILALQSIHYLISLFSKKPPQILRYLYGEKIQLLGSPMDKNFQQKCLQRVAQYKIQNLYKKLQELLKRGISKEKVWSDFLQVEGIEVTEAVFRESLHSYYCIEVEKMGSGVNRDAIESLRLIYVAGELEKCEGILICEGVSHEYFDVIKREMIRALGFVRKHALGLIEAFEINDATLNSVLGRKDGDVYKHMLEEAMNRNPLNKEKVFPGVNQYFQPKL